MTIEVNLDATDQQGTAVCQSVSVMTNADSDIHTLANRVETDVHLVVVEHSLQADYSQS